MLRTYAVFFIPARVQLKAIGEQVEADDEQSKVDDVLESVIHAATGSRKR